MRKQSIGAMPFNPKPPNTSEETQDVSFQTQSGGLGMHELDEEFNRRLRSKLVALEEVHSNHPIEGIKVPGIVVCGAPSAGKSSVMEYLSDLNFPRGENTCTRCPTIVSLETDPQTTSPYALIGLEADKSKRTRLDDLSLFGTKIEELTDQLTSKVGTGAGVITNVPIYVTVVRQKGPTLTLIDIPGITHLCTDGEQADIHAVTKDLVESYIKDDAMVILVVIPATDDFGNAEALKLAKQYDPEGTRTLGVVTKIDLLTTDSYDNLVKRITMQGKNIHLQLGFIGLRCRTAAEVKAGKTHSATLKAEEKLRNSHPLLAQLDSTQFGLRALARRIVDVQTTLVNANFPEITKLLVSRIEKAEADLAQRCSRMHETVRNLDRDVRNAVSGIPRVDNLDFDLSAKWWEVSKNFELAIRRATPNFFSDEYAKTLQASKYTVVSRYVDHAVNRTRPLLEAQHVVWQVRLADVADVESPHACNSLFGVVFNRCHSEIFFSKATSTNHADGVLMDKATQMLRLMMTAMNHVFKVLVNKHFHDFPRLKELVLERITELLELQSQAFMHLTQSLLKAEATMIASFDREVSRKIKKCELAAVTKPTTRDPDVPNELIEACFPARYHSTSESPTGTVRKMQIHLFCYKEELLKVIFHNLSKLIWSKLVMEPSEKLSTFLIEALSDTKLLERLMAEYPRMEE